MEEKEHICPITGKPCSKEKTCHITELNADKSYTELHLCDDCAGPYLEETTPEENPFAQFDKLIAQSVFAYLTAVLNSAAKNPVGPLDMKGGCPECGMTLSEIAKVGRIGCPACYEWFRPELVAVIDKAHGSTRHAGKRPANQYKVAQLESLKKKLAQAIKNEAYEDAAVLRDAIKQIEPPPVPKPE